MDKTRLALEVATEQHRAGKTTAFISLAELNAKDKLATAVA